MKRDERGGESPYPRVLIINGEPFTSRSATGLTLHSLFRGWPPERLGCLFVGDVQPDAGVCDNYWRLDSNNVPASRLVRQIIGKPSTGRNAVVPVSERDPAVQAVAVHWSERSRLYRWLRNAASEQSVMQLARYRVPPVVHDEIARFAPHVIYTMLGSNAVQRLVLDVQQRCRAPIVPHIMDDWPTTLYRNSVLRPLLRRALMKGFRDVLDRAPVRLVIGSRMAQEYASRYGGEFSSFMNGVEPEYLESMSSPAPASHKALITYIGGLHLNRWRSLREVGEALVELQREGLAAELLVYTQPRFTEEARKLDLPTIRLMGPLSPTEVPRVLREAHVLVHVESFDHESRVYARYSISTKIPECMAATRPIFAYGPAELASIQYVAECEAGVTVGSEDRCAVVAGLRRLIQSAQLRRSAGERGFAMAAACHNAERQRSAFRSRLERAALSARCAHAFQ
jgi:hypothetical protein